MVTTYSLYRSTQPNSRFPYPVATGLSAADMEAYEDTLVLPGVTYWYTLKKYEDGVLVGTSAEAHATAPTPLPPAPDTSEGTTSMRRIFSTGQLFFDTGSGPQEFAVLQEIGWSLKYDEKELRVAPWLNMFAHDRAFYNGQMTLTAKHATFLAAAIQVLTGGTNTPAVAADPAHNPPIVAVPGVIHNPPIVAVPGVIHNPPIVILPTGVMKIGKTVILPKFSGVFQTRQEDGSPVSVTCGNVRAPGLSIKYVLDDFAMTDFAMRAEEDADGNLATWEFPD